MVNGPPTPPPTTAAELQDEARVHQPTNPPIASTPAPPQLQSRQDSYQHIFPTIANLAAHNNFQELIRAAERGDLNGDGDRHPTRLLVTAPLVLAYLIVDDLSPARYALNRLPENLASTPLSKTLLGLLASSWERNHAQVYSRAEHLFHLVSQPDFLDAKLGSVIAAMVTTFNESFRHRTFVLLSKAYSSLPLSLAQTYLGLSADQLLVAAEKNGWSYNASTQVLNPSPAPSPIPSAFGAGSGSSSLGTFHLVADSVARLEM